MVPARRRARPAGGPPVAFETRPPVCSRRDGPPRHHAESGRGDLSCRIFRHGTLAFEGRVNTREMKRRCDELVGWLCRHNPVPPGTVLSTGTGILVPDEHALDEGDIVEIDLERVGRLRNPVRRLR
ncbi:MAG: fumarylacetoacetate hydrolase family protein [Candidatus Rokubacteria bacterium]|nr:fumarylacetoacetate hydrolase family protein [Candidatus Rokubacteria bacterium]